jgi:hypothetical protein
MPDRTVQIYLYVLIGLSLFSPLLWAIVWLAQSRRPRHPLIQTKHHWRNLFFLISGIIGWYIFSSRLLNNWFVMIAMIVLLVLSFYASELIGSPSKPGENNRAT